MKNADKLAAALAANETRLPEFQARADAINGRIRGWSIVHHYWFFKSWLDAYPEAKRILIVGVYLGRDISYMLDAAAGRELHVVGVDKFNAEPCDDWPQEKRGMSWEEAFQCPPPDLDAATANIGAKPPHVVQLIKADDKDWLESEIGPFDLIFLDASHEFASISRQIRACHKLCHPQTIVSGDDYSDVQPGWGVTEAVKESFKYHHHINYRIWFAGAEDYL